jgi:AraC family transcriptional regulator of adaptative response/methylated-DNA-[protein]-cysteine methyltransferase
VAEWKTTDSVDVIGIDLAHDIEYGFAATELGSVAVAWVGAHICWFMPGVDAKAKQVLAAYWQPAHLQRNDKLAAQRATALLEDPEHAPLLLRGTPWQLQTWQALRGSRAGETLSYAALAERAGAKRSAARAAGSAVAANHIAIAVPCHRVLPASGGVGGFRWGAPLKCRLLAGEQSRIGRQRGRVA